MSAVTAQNQSDVEYTPWWLVLIEGIALVILGLLLLANPRQTSVIVVQVLGLYWFFAGILSIVKIFIDSSSWGWKLFAGIVGIIAGLLVIQHPIWSTIILGDTLIILLGFGGIIIGGINIYQAFNGAGWGPGILGVISIILGLVLLGNIWIFRLSLPWVIGIFSLIGGIAAIVGAFRMKPEGSQPLTAEEAAVSPEMVTSAEEPAASPAAEVEEISEPATVDSTVEEPEGKVV